MFQRAHHGVGVASSSMFIRSTKVARGELSRARPGRPRSDRRCALAEAAFNFSGDPEVHLQGVGEPQPGRRCRGYR
jgi:hypothetical protein